MAEYIERDAFKKNVEERYCKPCKAEGKDHNGCWCRACWVDDMLDEVDCFPPADATAALKWLEALERLADYEDSGLTPAEVHSMSGEWCAMMSVLNNIGSYDRLRELAEADKDGRVVVLPCKNWLEVVFGDQVLFWGIDKDYEEQPIREISLDDAERIGWYDGYKTVFLKGTDENGEAWEFYPKEIGKTVFLTREDAEAALEGMKDE